MVIAPILDQGLLPSDEQLRLIGFYVSNQEVILTQASRVVSPAA
jgi:hypothetical protein